MAQRVHEEGRMTIKTLHEKGLAKVRISGAARSDRGRRALPPASRQEPAPSDQGLARGRKRGRRRSVQCRRRWPASFFRPGRRTNALRGAGTHKTHDTHRRRSWPARDQASAATCDRSRRGHGSVLVYHVDLSHGSCWRALCLQRRRPFAEPPRLRWADLEAAGRAPTRSHTRSERCSARA
jgi:hypothetical protein